MSIARMATFISFGVIAGFASGLLTLLVVGIKWASSMKRELSGEQSNAIISRIICSRCGTSFFENPQFGLKDVLCDDCKCPVCSACAVHYYSLWRCTSCIKKRDEIITRDLHLNDIKQRFPIMDNSSNSNNGRKESDVWNLIELIIQNIIGFSFQNVKIIKLSSDISYIEFMDKYEGVLSLTLFRLKTSIQLIVDGIAGNFLDNPTNIETQLKRLVQDIIEEATNIDPTKLVNLKSSSDINISSKTYEDILAIAILNKVVENVTLQPTNTQKHNDFKEQLNNERDILGNLKMEAKLRELKNHAFTKTLYQRKMSIPDLALEIPCNVNSNESRWEENWLFRRKKNEQLFAKSENKKQAVVPIFIPSPIIYVSPKIGDSCVDDISDLSDLSDSEIESLLDN